MENTQHPEGSKFVETQYHIEEISKSKPIFVHPLSDPKPVNEGKIFTWNVDWNPWETQLCVWNGSAMADQSLLVR